VEIVLRGQFARSVRGLRIRPLALPAWELGGDPVHGGRPGEDHPPDALPSRGEHDLDGSAHIDVVRDPGRDEGPRDRRDRRLVEDDLTTGTRLVQRGRVEDAVLRDGDGVAEGNKATSVIRSRSRR
jgi:hypothetical protein